MPYAEPSKKESGVMFFQTVKKFQGFIKQEEEKEKLEFDL